MPLIWLSHSMWNIFLLEEQPRNISRWSEFAVRFSCKRHFVKFFAINSFTVKRLTMVKLGEAGLKAVVLHAVLEFAPRGLVVTFYHLRILLPGDYKVNGQARIIIAYMKWQLQCKELSVDVDLCSIFIDKICLECINTCWLRGDVFAIFAKSLTPELTRRRTRQSARRGHG